MTASSPSLLIGTQKQNDNIRRYRGVLVAGMMGGIAGAGLL